MKIKKFKLFEEIEHRLNPDEELASNYDIRGMKINGMEITNDGIKLSVRNTASELHYILISANGCQGDDISIKCHRAY